MFNHFYRQTGQPFADGAQSLVGDVVIIQQLKGDLFVAGHKFYLVTMLLPDAGSVFKEMHMSRVTDVNENIHKKTIYRKCLFESMSNHMAKSSIWIPMAILKNAASALMGGM